MVEFHHEERIRGVPCWCVRGPEILLQSLIFVATRERAGAFINLFNIRIRIRSARKTSKINDA